MHYYNFVIGRTYTELADSLTHEHETLRKMVDDKKETLAQTQEDVKHVVGIEYKLLYCL